MVFTFAILISVWCLFVVGMAALFVTFHNKYLKKVIKIPAYSEIFTPVQWLTVVVFGYVAIWTALPQANEISYSIPIVGPISYDINSFLNMLILVLFTYFADDAHDLPEGIHDIDGDRKLGVKTYATSFGVKASAKISFTMFFISGILGISLFLRNMVTPIFLIPFIAVWLYTLNWSYRYIQKDEEDMKKLGVKVGQKGFDYLLITYNLIFLDVLIQVLYHHYG
ncbi:MAG: UbiA family prenyltransferase [Candidatus Thermoplasmatota archaeon]|nr:UbiA family prenyltransferase [Candidatus Thermoplasmatota archaeon]